MMMHHNLQIFSLHSLFWLIQGHKIGNTETGFITFLKSWEIERKIDCKMWAPKEWFVKTRYTQGSWLCETQSTVPCPWKCFAFLRTVEWYTYKEINDTMCYNKWNTVIYIICILFDLSWWCQNHGKLQLLKEKKRNYKDLHVTKPVWHASKL